MRILIASATCALLFAAVPARAQPPAASFEQLAGLVTPGDTITVVDAAGATVNGRIDTLSGDALTLDTASGPRTFGEADVSLVRQRRADSLKNGAIIGAAAGLVYFATAAALLKDSDGGDVIVESAISGGAVFAGLGAAVGMGIDALIRRRQVIYRKPAGQTVSIGVLTGRGRLGVAVGFRLGR